MAVLVQPRVALTIAFVVTVPVIRAHIARGADMPSSIIDTDQCRDAGRRSAPFLRRAGAAQQNPERWAS